MVSGISNMCVALTSVPGTILKIRTLNAILHHPTLPQSTPTVPKFLSKMLKNAE